MSADDVRHALNAEGADPLLLAGVNDANFAELQRAIRNPNRDAERLARSQDRTTRRSQRLSRSK